ncbi:double-strand break repair helicase AddA [Gymnodinialimonas ceratoperidinii]|uniref:DNA 3'-5' helicase n=1 Tax=Gymnodinialimonas ceratoperidinii TaxID=2856823 RepID=A0A8F6YDG3_9RHOB|nr:double-strand break repair helicase AddA [Gymnodinialimonas ceratoperidinii]QXT40162.1 double-strand break repair helicase AddA [Gymnodinialimonas ceratoperidinii]
MDDATRAQTRAADPGTSTWLGANAGSGKTRVLTDRVARLLLDGVPPERILCLTYTKAAAMEMQNRLFSRLGDWAMQDDTKLAGMLAAIGVSEGRLSADLLDDARTLFARAIEAPGGLKIQTIHSFCASVLRRFPLEARVSPAFTEIDERVQSRLIADLLDEMAETPEGRAALDLVAPHLSGDEGAMQLARAVAGRAEALIPPADWETICDFADIDPGLTESAVCASVILGDEADLAAAVIPHLEAGSRSTGTAHRALTTVQWDAPQMRDLATLEGAFLFGATTKAPFAPKIDKIGNAKTRAAIGDAMEPLNALMERIAEARPHRCGLMTARRIHALHTFAEQFLPLYARAKEARGWLDFDDLIDKTRNLLSNSKVAQWVLYRLDGGIDHILVDEAQDTAPRQWEIVQRLAEDFAAGEGAREDVRRTIFVVGDQKQSIYSFQGADPAEFGRMRDHFEARLKEIGAPFQDAALIHSFRSAAPILALVDSVAAGLGAPGLGSLIEHRSFFETKSGRVDLWPAIEQTKSGEKPAWDDPQDLVSEDHHSSVLAQTLAARIGDMIDTPPMIEVDGKMRPVEAGDILILVRSRSPLFHKIIGELKRAGLPVAGVDRSQLTSPLAVKDLMALCRFLATPEDDLSLACVLRSPLCGLSEAALYDLAHDRKGFLWSALRERAAEFPETHAMLTDLRDNAEFLKPYDLLERALIRHDGRRRLIARLGPEAEDAVDAMLAQALAYEATEVPSLTGFVGWLDSGDVQVKRDLSQATGQIRVMTVHGAKGLEAPVVILPDCAMPRGGGGGRVTLLQPDGGPVVWAPAKGDETDTVREAAAKAKDRDTQEANRLLYVALTRAESWLIVAASGALGQADAGSWYKIVADAMDGMGAEPLTVEGLEGTGLRLQSGAWPEGEKPDASTRERPALPDYATSDAPASVRDKAARKPSDLGGAKALPGVGDETAIAMQRGTITHLLLEHLPRLPQAAWQAAAPGIAALHTAELPEDALAPMLEEATRVLTAPDLAHLFTEDSLAEVEITGHSSTLQCDVIGIIDRLIVTDGTITAVDFKTNATVPETPEATPEGILRQMGAYAELLAAIYPGREINTAILWSRTGTLMPLPHDIVSAALKRASSA